LAKFSGFSKCSKSFLAISGMEIEENFLEIAKFPTA
jgi:hypothetical protein